MKIVFSDISSRENLLPLTFTRHASDLRVGILTLGEKWCKRLHAESSHVAVPYLQEKYPFQPDSENILVNPLVLPTDDLVAAIKSLKSADLLVKDDVWIAALLNEEQLTDYQLNGHLPSQRHEFETTADVIQHPWNLFQFNDQEIRNDYALICEGRASAQSGDDATLKGDDIFIEEGAQLESCILNAKSGPIYIGRNAKVEDGAIIQGPFALCDNATVNPGAKIRGASTIGPHSKVGGEVGNSILIGYSNKGHDGYMGNSVLGEWCNLGADTNTSNLKNNYGSVKAWNYPKGQAIDTQTQFCGLVMGDHSKCSINTMFNTGTVVGVSANIFGAGFPPKFIPSFSWGGAESPFVTYQIDKALATAKTVTQRRKRELTDVERQILVHVFNDTKTHRNE